MEDCSMPLYVCMYVFPIIIHILIDNKLALSILLFNETLDT